MLTKLFDFTDPTLYTFDANLIDFTVSQKPRLKLQSNPGQDFIQNFDNDTGFNYNPALAEFVGGKLQQKDQRPANSICGGTFTNSMDLSWASDGFVSLVHSEIGTPVLSAGKIQCLDGNNGVYWSDALIGNLAGNFVIKVKYTPDYNAAPSQNAQIIALAPIAGAVDRVVIFNSPSGNNLRITANGLAAVTLAGWNPVQGQEYVFELICIGNQISLYVDGVQIGTTKTIAPGQGTTAVRLEVGAGSGYAYANGTFDDIILYSSALQDENYIVPETSYATNNVILPEMEYTGAGTLVSFDAFTTVEGGSPRYTLQVGHSGNYLYWDGAAWSVSDGTYSQSNDAATFNANVGDLDIEGEIYGQFKIHFTDSNIQGNVDTLTASLTAQIYPLTNPTVVFTEPVYLEGLSLFSEIATKPGSDQIKYILSKDSVQYYWNGAAWVTSDGTYAQSNTAAEIEANKATFTTSGIGVEIEMFLHSDNGVTTPEISLVLVSYNFYGGNVGLPHQTIVFGVCYGEDGNLLPDVEISITLSKKEVTYNTEIILFDIPVIETTSDANGYWEANLIDTVNMDGAKWVFTFTYDGKSKTYTRGVPEEDSYNFAALPF